MLLRHAWATRCACSRPARKQFRRSIEGLQDEWQGWTYDLLSRNCNHFCEALVEILGVGPLPGASDERQRMRNGPSNPARPDSSGAAAWVNRFAVNADYALETSQTALTEVKKIWKNSADTLTLATGWLKDHLTIGAPAARMALRLWNCPDLPPRNTDPALLAVPPPFGPQQQPQQPQQNGAGGAATQPSTSPPATAATAPATAAASKDSAAAA